MGKPGRCTFRGACHLLMRSSQSHGTETGQSRDLSLNYQKKQVISKTCSGYSRGCTKGQEKGQEFQRSPYFTRGRQLRNKKWPFSPRCALIDTTETYKVVPTTERVTYAGVGPERRVEWCGRDGFSGWHPDTSLRPSVSNRAEERNVVRRGGPGLYPWGTIEPLWARRAQDSPSTLWMPKLTLGERDEKVIFQFILKMLCDHAQATSQSNWRGS